MCATSRTSTWFKNVPLCYSYYLTDVWFSIYHTTSTWMRFILVNTQSAYLFVNTFVKKIVDDFSGHWSRFWAVLLLKNMWLKRQWAITGLLLPRKCLSSSSTNLAGFGQHSAILRLKKLCRIYGQYLPSVHLYCSVSGN